MSHVRGTSALLLLLLMASCLSFGCAKEHTTDPQPRRVDDLLQEVWFQNAFRFLADIQEKLADPVLRTEIRLHFLAGDDAWAFQRLGYSREDLGAFLAQQELLSAGVKSRWPELEEYDAPPAPMDPRAELLQGLRAEVWPAPAVASSKEFYTCAIVAFFEEFNRCTLLQGEIYATIGCILDAYWRFLDSMSSGC